MMYGHMDTYGHSASVHNNQLKQLDFQALKQFNGHKKTMIFSQNRNYPFNGHMGTWALGRCPFQLFEIIKNSMGTDNRMDTKNKYLNLLHFSMGTKSL